MEWKSILLLLALLCYALFIFYRVVKKKKWCPDIYGTGACEVKKKSKKETGKDPSPTNR